MPTPPRPLPPSLEHALRHFRGVETVVPGDRHVLLEGEVVVFALLLRHVVNHVRGAVLVALVRDDADVLDMLEHYDVAARPAGSSRIPFPSDAAPFPIPPRLVIR